LDDDKERWKCPSCFFTDKKTQQPLQCCYDGLKTRSRKHEAEEEQEEKALRKRRRSLEIEELELKQLRLANEKSQLELDAQRLSNEKRRESNTGLRLALEEDELKKDLSRISPRRPYRRLVEKRETLPLDIQVELHMNMTSVAPVDP
jgi:hypothetical protein